MALGYTPKPLPQMNMGIQPQLPQPNGFGVFGNDQMLQQNLMRQPGVRPPGMENVFITPAIRDGVLQPKSQGQGSYGGRTYDGFTMGPDSLLWAEGKIPNRRGEYFDPKTRQIINPTASGQPRKFPWSSGEPAPERDWEAILDFQKNVGFRGTEFKSIDVNKALKYPDMVNQAFGRTLTVTNLTPQLKASLEKQGFKIDVPKYGGGKFASVKFGSGVEAFQAADKLKSFGADIEFNPFKRAIPLEAPAPTPKEQKLGKETSQVLAKTLFG